MLYGQQKNRIAPAPGRGIISRYVMRYDIPTLPNLSQPTPYRASQSSWIEPSTVTKINVDTTQTQEISSKSSSSCVRPWEIVLGIILLLLLLAIILIPILVEDSLQITTTTTMTTTTTTTTALPSQCSSYTINSDSTRYYTYSGTTTYCDNSSPFGSSPTWIRFTGATGTQLANSVISINQCGTVSTGYYVGSLPTVAMTVQGTVCFSASGNSCSNPTLISVTNCNGFYIYYLTAVSSCNARYCTM